MLATRCELHLLYVVTSLAVTSSLATGAERSSSESSPPQQHEVLQYAVDLEAEPSARFAHVWDDFLRQRGAAAFAQTYGGWQKWAQTVLPELFETPLRAAASQSAWLDALREAHPAAVAELAALSEKLVNATGGKEPLFELPVMAAVVSIYPLLNIARKNTTDTIPSACTSSLVQRPDGSLLHGRSLDYEPRDPMALATVVVDFRRSGQPVYRCLMPLVYPTALQWFTCVRPGAFSLSVNARAQGIWTEHNASFEELLRRVRMPGAQLLGEVAESAMQKETYEEALRVLSSSSVVSSNYFILAGAHGQGAIVTRYGNESSADVWTLGPDAAPVDDDGQAPWMRIQTNVDHWVPIESGAYATHRRQRVIDELSDLGRNALSRDALLEVYLTNTARKGSENRTEPEDTGVILRPSTIATLILDPARQETDVDPHFWRIWKTSPVIRPSGAGQNREQGWLSSQRQEKSLRPFAQSPGQDSMEIVI